MPKDGIARIPGDLVECEIEQMSEEFRVRPCLGGRAGLLGFRRVDEALDL